MEEMLALIDEATALKQQLQRTFGCSRALRNQRMHFSRQEAGWVHGQQRCSIDLANRTLEAFACK